MLEIQLAARPVGWPKESDFSKVDVPTPVAGVGEVLVKVEWLSVDPYMRGRMNDAKSYVPPFALDAPLAGGGVGRVIASDDPTFSVGCIVTGMLRWREFDNQPVSALTKLEDDGTPLEWYLGALGMPGLTAYVGLLEIGSLKAGETVYVSAAAGAVGSLVGQIAKIKGARAVGSAGGPDKVRRLAELGFDAGIDYRSTDLRRALEAACPSGIDVYFDNVGGDHLEAALWNMADRGRVVMCGAISQYNATAPSPGPSNLFVAIQRRLRLQGFIVSDHGSAFPSFVRDMKGWIASGEIENDQTVIEGLSRTPDALVALMRGENLGKMLVKVS